MESPTNFTPPTVVDERRLGRAVAAEEENAFELLVAEAERLAVDRLDDGRRAGRWSAVTSEPTLAEAICLRLLEQVGQVAERRIDFAELALGAA